MKRILALTVPSLSCFVFLIGCAPTTKELTKEFVADPIRPKCYESDSTRFISREQHEKMFQGVDGADSISFLPCDSSATGFVRIRPKDSRIQGKTSSYVAYGLNLAQTGLSVGLVVAQQNPLWILLPALHLQPISGINYRIDYRDSTGEVLGRDLSVHDSAWFRDRDETRDSLLERSRREVSTALFGFQYPPAPKPLRSWRLTADILPPLLSASNGGVWIEPHFEKYLPNNFTVDVSPAVFIPFSKPDHRYSVYAGPRLYFFGDHTGVFVGVEPYVEVAQYYGHRYSRIALPVTFGGVWRGGRMIYGVDFGVGPAHVLAGIYDEPDYLVLGSFYWGIEF